MTEIKVITPKEGKALLETNKNITLLDVRRIDEYMEGHIPGAINIPVEDLPSTSLTKLLPSDSDIVVYCKGGLRAEKAAKFLIDHGYKKVISLGGITDWPYEITK